MEVCVSAAGGDGSSSFAGSAPVSLRQKQAPPGGGGRAAEAAVTERQETLERLTALNNAVVVAYAKGDVVMAAAALDALPAGAAELYGALPMTGDGFHEATLREMVATDVDTYLARQGRYYDSSFFRGVVLDGEEQHDET